MQHNIIPGNMQQNVPGHLNHSNYHGNIPSAANMFGGAPYTSFQGHFLVPVKAEVEQLPVAQLRDRFMEFVQVGRVQQPEQLRHGGGNREKCRRTTRMRSRPSFGRLICRNHGPRGRGRKVSLKMKV